MCRIFRLGDTVLPVKSGPSPEGPAGDLAAAAGETPMLRCRDIVELLGDYLDGALPPATGEALRAHLADCSDCTAFINTYRGTVRAARYLREEQIPPQLRERLLAFLRQQNRS